MVCSTVLLVLWRHVDWDVFEEWFGRSIVTLQSYFTKDLVEGAGREIDSVTVMQHGCGCRKGNVLAT